MILSIAVRELRSHLLSPLSWSLLAVMQLLLSWLFLAQLEGYLKIQPRLAGLQQPPGVTDLVAVPLLDSAAIILMLLVPLLSMGLFSREFSSGSFNLLLSSPVAMSAIVLGKYLALLCVLSVMLLLVALMPLSLLLGTPLDLGMLAAGLLGLALTLAAYGALGLLLSSFTKHPAIAAASSYGLLVLLWIVNLADSSTLFQMLSLSSRFQRLLSGVVDTGDLAYYLLLILTCLLLCIRRLDTLRTRG